MSTRSATPSPSILSSAPTREMTMTTSIKRLRTSLSAFVTAFGLLGASAASAQVAPAPAKTTPASKVSTESDRKKVSITVYNGNFALVREVRELADLGKGRVALEVRDVAATIQPETVAIQSLGGAGKLNVLEQNYRFDLLTPQTLIEKYVGRNVRLYRYHEATGKESVVDAKLLSTVGDPVYEIGGELTFGYPGRLAFKELPPNLIAKPTLVWLLDSQEPKQSVEVTYLANDMNWKADYVLVLDAAEKKADLTGWVTLSNHTGASYENAELKLVAGDVNRQRDDIAMNRAYKSVGGAPAADTSFREESLLEYHLYTLGRPTTVLNNEQKQVSLLDANGLGVEKKLVLKSQPYWYRSHFGQNPNTVKVGVFLNFQNSEKNRLGMPLPKGVVRVYKADKGGARQFVGEDAIDHTPRDEEVSVKLGEAFDVVAERKQMEWVALGGCGSESSWEIELRNHKDENVSVRVEEPTGGEWTVVNSSHPASREDANTITFDVPVQKRGKSKLTYKVRVRWC
jgi:hypothetical protein